MRSRLDTMREITGVQAKDAFSGVRDLASFVMRQGVVEVAISLGYNMDIKNGIPPQKAQMRATEARMIALQSLLEGFRSRGRLSQRMTAALRTIDELEESVA